MFRWLIEQRYVLANPFAGLKVRGAQRNGELDISRAFTAGEWELIRTIADGLEWSHGWAVPAAQRLRFLLDFGYATGLRAGELVSVTLGGIMTGTRGERWLHLTGKGAKAGKVVLPPLARVALDQYLMQRGLPVSPARWTPDTPLLGHLDESGGITTPRLRQVLRRFFHTAADAIEADHPALADKLQRTTPHARNKCSRTGRHANDCARQSASRVDHNDLDLPGRRRSPAYAADRADLCAAAANVTTVHETIYPVLPAEPGATELKAVFTPSTSEIRFVRRQSRQEASAVLVMVQLKLLQRLGYFPMLVEVPPAIIDHIRTSMRARVLSRTAIARYDVSGTRIRHQKLLRSWLDIRAFDASEAASPAELASAEARTKIELPDIINVLIEGTGPAPVRTAATGNAAAHRHAGAQRSQRGDLWGHDRRTRLSTRRTHRRAAHRQGRQIRLGRSETGAEATRRAGDHQLP
jgi:hypothetical protein